MKQYEYKIEQLSDDIIICTEELNVCGRDGWMLVNIYKEDGYRYAVFYRNLEDHYYDDDDDDDEDDEDHDDEEDSEDADEDDEDYEDDDEDEEDDSLLNTIISFSDGIIEKEEAKEFEALLVTEGETFNKVETLKSFDTFAKNLIRKDPKNNPPKILSFLDILQTYTIIDNPEKETLKYKYLDFAEKYLKNMIDIIRFTSDQNDILL